MFASWVRRCALGVTVAALVGAPFLQPAQAATNPPTGRFITVVQDTFLHQLHVEGWAYDPAAPRKSIRVHLIVDGVLLASVLADKPSPAVDQRFDLTGDHRYVVNIRPLRWAKTVTAKSRGVNPDGPLTTLGTRSVSHYYPPPGERTIDIAKKYVGYPYVEGGASPSGFDCSGYTMYAYQHADVKKLVHSAEGQRESMRRISRADARPGDLVFYMSGGTAYHVAIYAGHGWQYAAATPKDGVRYQRVWSSYVRYGTDWH